MSTFDSNDFLRPTPALEDKRWQVLRKYLPSIKDTIETRVHGFRPEKPETERLRWLQKRLLQDVHEDVIEIISEREQDTTIPASVAFFKSLQSASSALSDLSNRTRTFSLRQLSDHRVHDEEHDCVMEWAENNIEAEHSECQLFLQIENLRAGLKWYVSEFEPKLKIGLDRDPATNAFILACWIFWLDTFDAEPVLTLDSDFFNFMGDVWCAFGFTNPSEKDIKELLLARAKFLKKSKDNSFHLPSF